MVLVGVVPGLDEAVAHGVGGSLVGAEVVKVESSAREGVLNMVNDRPLDRVRVRALVSAHQLPKLVFALFLFAELGAVQLMIGSLIVFLELELRVLALDRRILGFNFFFLLDLLRFRLLGCLLDRLGLGDLGLDVNDLLLFGANIDVFGETIFIFGDSFYFGFGF